MARAINAGQSVIQLPGCEIYRLKTFPRIVDGQAAPGCTVVAFTMEDTYPITFNGWTKDRPSLMIGHDGARYHAIEVGPGDYGMIVFHPQVTERDWPLTPTTFAAVAITSDAEKNLRNLLLSAFAVATESPEETSMAVTGLKESFLSAIDEAIISSDDLENECAVNKKVNIDLVLQLDTYLSTHHQESIYSAQLASRFGVSLRTLANTITHYRGMSLHKYLRLKRLWLVRQQLLDGETSIKAATLANGFWHLGDFASAYRKQFGEKPSQTAARNRR